MAILPHQELDHLPAILFELRSSTVSCDRLPISAGISTAPVSRQNPRQIPYITHRNTLVSKRALVQHSPTTQGTTRPTLAVLQDTDSVTPLTRVSQSTRQHSPLMFDLRFSVLSCVRFPISAGSSPVNTGCIRLPKSRMKIS